jgi:hypothetical protein
MPTPRTWLRTAGASGRLQNQNHSYLSFSGTGTAVYTVTALDDATCKWFDYVA